MFPGVASALYEMREKFDEICDILEGVVGISDEDAKRWLRVGAVNPEQHYQYNLDLRLDGTCEWICLDPLWEKYLKGETNLWLEGIPGEYLFLYRGTC